MKKSYNKSRTCWLVLMGGVLLLAGNSWSFVAEVNTGSIEYWGEYLPSRAVFNSAVDSPAVNTGSAEFWRERLLPAFGVYEIIGVGPEVFGVMCYEKSGGTEIIAGVWQSDADPYLSWHESTSPSGVAEYKYRIDSSLIDDANGISTGLDTAVQLAADTLSDAQHTIYFKATNKTGTWGETASFGIWVDQVVPDIGEIIGWNDSGKTEILASEVWQNTTDDPFLEWNDPANLSGNVYYYTTDGSEPESADSGVAELNLNLGSLGEGSTTINVRPRSGAGLWGNTRSFVLNYDITAPSEVSGLQGDRSASTWSNQSAVTFVWTDSVDDGSGISGYAIGIDLSPADWSGTEKNLESGIETITVYFTDGDGNYFHIRSVDNAGNWDDTSADLGPYWVDTVPPMVQILECYTDASKSEQVFEVQWTTESEPYFTWNEPESAAPISGYRYALDGELSEDYSLSDNFVDYQSNPIPEGQHEFKVQARDEAGNEGDIQTFVLNIGEVDAPILNLTLFLHGYLDTATFVDGDNFAQQTATMVGEFRISRNQPADNQYYFSLDDQGRSGMTGLPGLLEGDYYLLLKQRLYGGTFSSQTEELPLGSHHFPVISQEKITIGEGVSIAVNFSDQCSPNFVEGFASSADGASSPMIELGTSGRYWMLGGGDANGDSIINITDIAIWDTQITYSDSSERGRARFTEQGNFDGNERINLFDFNVWAKMRALGATWAPYTE